MVTSIDHYQIAYWALPKAACSSVKAALAKIDPNVYLPPPDNIENVFWHRLYPTERYRPKRWRQYEGYWRFCVVRDPVKRLISCYTDRVVKRRELRRSRKIGRGIVELPTDPDPDYFFQNLCRYQRAASVIKHHTLPAPAFLGKSLTRFDSVFRTEELHLLAADLGLKTGHDIELQKENTSNMKLGLDDLRPETIDALRPYLLQEYDYLRDYYDDPFGKPFQKLVA